MSSYSTLLFPTGIRSQARSPLFRSTIGKTGVLTALPMHRVELADDPPASGRLQAKIGCHTLRATGITAYLSNGGVLEHAQEMAAHDQAL